MSNNKLPFCISFIWLFTLSNINCQIYRLDVEESEKRIIGIDSIPKNEQSKIIKKLKSNFKNLDLFAIINKDTVEVISGGKFPKLTKVAKSKIFINQNIDSSPPIIFDKIYAFKLTQFDKKDSIIEKLFSEIRKKDAIKKYKKLVEDSLIVFGNKKIKYDTISEGDTVITNFVFKNLSPDTLYINDVKANCGCAKAKWPNYPISPGKLDSITTYFYSEGKSNGINLKSFRVYHSFFDDPIWIRIEGFIESDIQKKNMNVKENPYEILLDTLNKEELNKAKIEFQSEMTTIQKLLSLQDSSYVVKKFEYEDFHRIDTIKNQQYIIFKDLMSFKNLLIMNDSK